jgi:uncharacterized membrane protein
MELIEMDKKTIALCGNALIGGGIPLVLGIVIVSILIPVVLEIWQLIVVFELVGIVMIIAGVMLFRKNKIPFFKKANAL